MQYIYISSTYINKYIFTIDKASRTFMCVIVEIDVGRLNMGAPEMTIWDPCLWLSDRDRTDPSPGPRLGSTSRISSCSDFVKARDVVGFDAEEI